MTHWVTSLFDLRTFAETFAESELRSKYLLKSKSEVISLSENMAGGDYLQSYTYGQFSKLKQSGTKNKCHNGYTMM